MRPEYAALVAAPAYDSLTPLERYRYAEHHPMSFLAVTRSVTDFPADLAPDADELRRQSAARVRSLLNEGVFDPPAKPALFLYRLETGDHSQLGVVADVPVSEYETGNVKPHELTDPEREAEMTRFLEEIRVAESAIGLAYAPRSEISQQVSGLAESTPSRDFESADGLRHTIWTITDEQERDALVEAFEAVSTTYITDGHHRAAAAARIARRRRSSHSTGDEPTEYVLAALFPADQLRIFPFHRCIRLDRPQQEILSTLEDHFDIVPVRNGDDPSPRRPGELGLLIAGTWYRLTAIGATEVLDVTLAHDRVITPLLENVPEPSGRVDFIGGPEGLTDLIQRCELSGEIGLALYPTSVDDVMRVSDQGGVMPPKSTWFDPKLRSGIFLVSR